jgi:hypothetical protein
VRHEMMMSLLLAYGSLRSLLSNSLFSNRSRMLQGNLKSNLGRCAPFPAAQFDK